MDLGPRAVYRVDANMAYICFASTSGHLHRHCERSEAIQSGTTQPWIASLRSQ
jgi:hypothetical protein